ncbi:MAG: hypothetical protein JW918_06420 [Anaerolineae bacterium]|nr:hypothetical protein [Anaerolineae bacterium]
MAKAVSNTSPLLYLYRIDALGWLPKLFTEIWTPGAVVGEFEEGRRRGYDVPNPRDYACCSLRSQQVAVSGCA